MKPNCNHIFNLVNPGINTPSYGQCIYCGQRGDDAIRLEHMPILGEHRFNVDTDFFTPPMPWGRFNCAGEYIFYDHDNAAFLGHDLNHK